MSSENEEKLPMLEQTAEPATEAPADRSEETEPEVSVPSSPVEPQVSADSEAPASEVTNHTDATNHPIKPPRLKSMRSKEGSPLLKAQVTEEVKDADIEAAPDVVTYAPAEDASENTQPYAPTTAPLHVKQDAVKPRKKFGLDYILGNKWLLLGIIAVILIILIITIVGVSVSRPKKKEVEPPPNYDDPVAYDLKCGIASGSWELNHTVAVFKGIPYLKPPVDSKRWTYDLEMNDISDCNGTEAKEYKGPCFQLNPAGTEPRYIGDEDCLYLNIWAPATSPTDALKREEEHQLPVLVFIHGGFLHYGSGHDEMQTPSAELAIEMDAVIVSFNYRLNVFGYMALENLVPGHGKMSGNFGLFDQISALKWVKEYIVNFGGNPNKVTVSGISSGGTSVLALLANPEARSTFQRAWLSGASSKFDGPKSETMKANRDVYLRNVGCSDAAANPRDCLLEKTSEELVDAIPWLQYPSWGALDLIRPPVKGEFIGAVLINDEYYLKKAPDVILRDESQDLDIPILIGNNDFESDMYQVEPVSTWTWGQYSDYVRSKYDTFNQSISDYILQSYAPQLKYSTRLHLARHVSDIRSICPQTFVAEIISSNTKSKVFRYVNTARLPQKLTDKYQAGSTVATHATEFMQFFHYSQEDSEEFKTTKENFRSVVKEFMLDGMITGWASFPATYNISSSSIANTTQWTYDSCTQWRRSFYPAYSWMN